MTKDEAKKYFLKGYERGLRDMVSEVLKLAARGYGVTELSVVIKAKLFERAVEDMDRKIEGGDAVVVVEGLEYLVTQNSFPAILRFVQTIHEKVVVKDSYLLASANPEAFREADYRQLAQAVTAEL